MIVETPQIRWHGNTQTHQTEVYTLDIQPGEVESGTFRIVTGGDEIRVWFVTLPSRNANNLPSIEYRASLTRHEGLVNVVRFSPNGRWLASGDTLGKILVWERVQDEIREREREQRAREIIENYGKSRKALGRKNDDNDEDGIEIIEIEIWSSGKVYSHHSRDVNGIAWSPDSRYFCTTAIDRAVFLVEVEKFCPLKVLNDAEHFVLGVAWHPTSSFLGTSSMDKTLRLYHPFGEDTKPFVKLTTLASGEKLYFDDTNCIQQRQLDFSPDGNYLLTTAGVYKKAACSYIYRIKKPNDKVEKPLLVLPSIKPTTLARFCPRIFKLRNNKEKNPQMQNCSQRSEISVLNAAVADIDMEDPQPSTSSFSPADSEPEPSSGKPLISGLPYRMLFAIGGGDVVTLYDTEVNRPFAVISGIHTSALTDLSWSSDGRMLVISSLDGYCTSIEFEKNELGEEYLLHGKPKIAEPVPVASKPLEPGAPNILQVRRITPCAPSTSRG